MSNVTIAMALHNKEDALANVLLSIKKQKTDHDYNFCFLDDMSTSDPRPTISTFFPSEQVTYKRAPTGGFQFIPRLMANMIPEETEYVFYQSSDIIWFDPELMDKMIKEVEAKRCVAVPQIFNFEVESQLWKNPSTFYQNLLENSKDPHRYGDKKKSHYLYLSAMRKDDFMTLTEVSNKKSFACDIILRNKINEEITFEYLSSMAIHQRHPNIVYECSSVNNCSLECVQKEWAAKKVQFPFNLGTYNYVESKYIK